MKVAERTHGKWGRGGLPLVGRVLAALVGAVFLAAGLMKATDLGLFVRQIKAYGLVTDTPWVTLIAWSLIPLECALGAALIVSYRPRLSLGLSAVLLTAFIGITSWASFTGITDACGCFGPWMKQTPKMESLQNILLLVLVIAAWWMRPSLPGGGTWQKGLVVALACAFGVALPLMTGVAVTTNGQVATGPEADGIFHEIQVHGHGLEYVDFTLGDSIVVLFGTNCSHCRQSVPQLNALAQIPDLPELIALCSDDEAQCMEFVEEFLPVFPIGHIDEDTFWRLLGDGSLPRVFLVRNGTVIHTWNQAVPDGPTVRSILVSRQSANT